MRSIKAYQKIFPPPIDTLHWEKWYRIESYLRAARQKILYIRSASREKIRDHATLYFNINSLSLYIYIHFWCHFYVHTRYTHTAVVFQSLPPSLWKTRCSHDLLLIGFFGGGGRFLLLHPCPTLTGCPRLVATKRRRKGEEKCSKTHRTRDNQGFQGADVAHAITKTKRKYTRERERKWEGASQLFKNWWRS